MGHGYPITRWAVLASALAGLIWLAFSHSAQETGQVEPAADHPHPLAPSPSPLGSAATGSTVWPVDLLTRDMKPNWQERRARLKELGRSYHTEPDSARSCALRDSIEDLLHRSIREVQEHRLSHARTTGQTDMVRYLEHTITSFPEPDSLTDDLDQASRTTQQTQRRIEP